MVLQFATFAFGGAGSPSTRPAPRPTTAPADQPFPAMRQWFSDLANADGKLRDQATVSLMGLRPDDLPALQRLVRENQPLLPEQAIRIRQIVTHVFLSGDPYDVVHIEGKDFQDKGFLGIILPSQESGDPAIVVDRIPGFVAERLLCDGDVILSIQERPDRIISSSGTLMSALVDVPAGQRLHFQILRQGQVMTIPIALDPRPVEAADPVTAMKVFTLRRFERAQDYWNKQFAELVGEG